MIDRSLNYGRQHISNFLTMCSPFGVVVDLGAGHGADLALARQVNAQASFHGIEARPDYARELESQRIIVHRLDLERDPLPFADETVDVLIMNQILEHTKDLFWILHEASRVLRVGGALIIGVPNLASAHNRFLLLTGRQPTSIKVSSAHVRGFTKPGILRFLRDCWPNGYDLRASGGSNFYPIPPIVARLLAWAFPSLAWGIFLLFEKRLAYSREFLDYPTREKLETKYYVGTPESCG